MVLTDKAASAIINRQQGQIFQITANHSSANPGVTAVVTQLSRYLAKQGWPTRVLVAGAAETPMPEGVKAVEFPIRPGLRIWRYPDNLASYLSKIEKESGVIFHVHGVWGAASWLAARASARQKIPALLSAHDMISPWHWKDGRVRRLKKLLYWHLMAYPKFRYTTMIHAITLQERDHLSHLFPGQEIQVIPNAIDMEEVDQHLSERQVDTPPAGNGRYLLFLGRLHPKKGVDILLQAFSQAIKNRDFHLLIVGPDSTPAYTAKLKSLAITLGMEKKVTFWGPAFGPEKWQLYRQAYAFCSPSRSEVIGLVNLEAAAAGRPVITTHETGLFDWEEGGGLLIRPQVDELAGALEQVFSWSEREREERGQSLRQLVKRRYSWEAVGPQWINLYSLLREKCG